MIELNFNELNLGRSQLKVVKELVERRRKFRAEIASVCGRGVVGFLLLRPARYYEPVHGMIGDYRTHSLQSLSNDDDPDTAWEFFGTFLFFCRDMTKKVCGIGQNSEVTESNGLVGRLMLLEQIAVALLQGPPGRSSHFVSDPASPAHGTSN